MSTLHVESTGDVTTRPLAADASSRVLVSAARLQSLVHLFRTVDLAHPDLEASLIACEDDALRMRIIARRWDGSGAPAEFHARIMDTPACFHFETRLLDPLPRSGSATVRMSRPEILRIEERRAAVRRQFREDIPVKLWGISGTHNQPCTAVLLNFCGGGLACRVSGAGGGGFITGTTVRLAFNPDETAAGEINVAARIVSATAASDPDVVILGLEFDKESLGRAAQERIAAAITQPS